MEMVRMVPKGGPLERATSILAPATWDGRVLMPPSGGNGEVRRYHHGRYVCDYENKCWRWVSVFSAEYKNPPAK